MAARTITIPHKRGATFSWGGTANLPAGTWACTAYLETAAGALIEAMGVTLTPPVSPATLHAIVLSASGAATSDWPIGTAKCDLKFTDASIVPVVLYSPTFLVKVETEITG